MIKKAVIPVAGRGTRFRPISKYVPKEMLPVIDKPVIHYVVEEALAAGIEDVIIVVNKEKDMLVEYLEETFGDQCNLMATYQDKPLGLGHAILCAEPMVDHEPFAVLLGDDLVDAQVPCIKQLMDIYSFHNKTIIGAMEVPESQASKYGIITGKYVTASSLHVQSLTEKPKAVSAGTQLAIAGRYVLHHNVFRVLRETLPSLNKEIQLTDALNVMSRTMGVLAYRFRGVRFDAGDKVGLINANNAYLLKRPELMEAK